MDGRGLQLMALGEIYGHKWEKCPIKNKNIIYDYKIKNKKLIIIKKDDWLPYLSHRGSWPRVAKTPHGL
jgi:hypothetical protein